MHDIDELREQFTATWHNPEQSITDSAIDQWRKPMLEEIDSRFGHITDLITPNKGQEHVEEVDEEGQDDWDDAFFIADSKYFLSCTFHRH